MTKRLLLILLYCHLALFSLAQQQGNIWYFGNNAGLDFSGPTPAAITGGQINTNEGEATISDGNGNLLFYTDGVKIWNRNHGVMQNGTGLLGNFSSTQSAIIVPKINDLSFYYVFTVDELGHPGGLNYSLVDMTLDGGLGAVTVKNVQLQTPVCEKLTAVKHCNGKDIWVIVHGVNSNAFYAYLLTAAGINAPVISNTGRVITSVVPDYTIGYLKASPDGKKLAAAHHFQGADLMDFDNITGIVSNGVSIFKPTETYGAAVGRGAYGVEFSSNSKFLYISGDYFDVPESRDYSYVLQYNVTLPDIASIQASKQIIYRQPPAAGTENFGSLQMARNGKIYLAEAFQRFLSVINKPDLPGAACQFVHAQCALANNTGSVWGLPTFIQSYWKSGFNFRGNCNETLINFENERTPDVTAVKWDFGDPASGGNNSSAIDSPFHNFSALGTYTVKLIRYTNCGQDTVNKQVELGGFSINLGADTIICSTPGYVLDPHVPVGGGYAYLWQNNSNSPTLAAQTSGLYWVEVTKANNVCVKRDSIQITYGQDLQVNLGPDLSKCNGQSQLLTVSVPSATYLWNTGNTNNTQVVTQTGTYWVEVSVNGCKKRDSIDVVFYPYPYVNFGNDTLVCENDKLLLDAGNSGAQYLWQDNTIAQTLPVNTNGTYWVNITKNGCSYADTVKVTFGLKPAFSLGNDTVICMGSPIRLKPIMTNQATSAYLWSTGTTSTDLWVTDPGMYSLELSNSCGVLRDEIVIDKGVCDVYVPSAFTPNNDGRNDVFKSYYGENVNTFIMQVRNRFGQLVFETADRQAGWDGNFKTAKQPAGTYVWTIKYKNNNSSIERLLQGTVILIR